MESSKLKSYAPKARQDFIAAVTRRAAKFGLTAKGSSPVREEGTLVMPYLASSGVLPSACELPSCKNFVRH